MGERAAQQVGECADRRLRLALSHPPEQESPIVIRQGSAWQSLFLFLCLLLMRWCCWPVRAARARCQDQQAESAGAPSIICRHQMDATAKAQTPMRFRSATRSEGERQGVALRRLPLRAARARSGEYPRSTLLLLAIAVERLRPAGQEPRRRGLTNLALRPAARALARLELRRRHALHPEKNTETAALYLTSCSPPQRPHRCSPSTAAGRSTGYYRRRGCARRGDRSARARPLRRSRKFAGGTWSRRGRVARHHARGQAARGATAF